MISPSLVQGQGSKEKISTLVVVVEFKKIKRLK
jgi:hypothetical protein